MAKQLIKLLIIMILALYITGCGSKIQDTTEQPTEQQEETVSDLPEEDITEIDTIDQELDDSEIDDITGELAELDW